MYLFFVALVKMQRDKVLNLNSTMRPILFLFIPMVMLMSACKTVKVAEYVHEESQRFFMERKFEDKVLDNSKFNEVLYVVEVKRADNDNFSVKLGLFAKEKGKAAFVKNATFLGKKSSIESMIDRELKLEVFDVKTNLYSFDTGLTLFFIKQDELTALYEEGGMLSLSITYNADGDTASFFFELKQRIDIWVPALY